MNRSEFIKNSLLAGVALSSSTYGFARTCFEEAAFELPKLPYTYAALESVIDKKTMEIHHSKHHQGYVNKLNKVLADASVKNVSLEDILKNISKYTVAVRNNAGGHYNHSLFWTALTPHKNTQPSEGLLQAIKDQFGDLESMKTMFNKAAKSRFGSGWAWLSVDENDQLFISSTPNQDNPLMDISTQRGRPILGIDVWEHAYYLNYQNKRGDYLSAIWSIINWEEVSRRYAHKG